MKRKQHLRTAKLIMIITLLFIVIAGSGICVGSRYINSQLLTANENMAVDTALLVKNNFRITDAEVAYMKSLTFNEMEVDPINLRLMDIGNGVKLNADITNVYIVAPLAEEEIKYTTDEETSEFFGYENHTKLDGVWLLNGIIDDYGHFQATQRDDIYRYTQLDESQKAGMKTQEAFGEFSKDAWGTFITGYAPIYTTEGNFVGLLGIDVAPDKYQQSAQNMIFVLFAALVVISLAMIGLFLYFYFKYVKAKEGQLYFDFYSRMSHDMRTPMNGILGMAELSKDENDVEILHQNFKRVEESGRYMLGLINDTLDVQKLDAGRLRLDPKIRRSGELVKNLSAMIKNDAEKKHINLEVICEGIDENSYIYVDELRIQQIFMNIMSNSIKFTPEGGTVRFFVKCTGKHENFRHMKLMISDTGIGMSRKFIDNHLFKPFEQEQNSVTTQYGGSGLGLSIVKNLVELMGGTIEVESEEGSGTTFTIYIDVQTIDAETAEKELKNSGKKPLFSDTLKGKNILLCEDHPLNAEIASRLLEKSGVSTTVASNGREGLTIFTEKPAHTFDAVLMDIRMPVMDGLQAARAIRASKKEDAINIPIIAMTANAYDEDIENCLKAGMNDHIAKPVDPEKMYKTLAGVLSDNKTPI